MTHLDSKYLEDTQLTKILWIINQKTYYYGL